jgi:hypothetical protein
MPYLLAGFFLLWLALTGMKSFTRVSPAAAALILRRIGGLAALALAALLLVRGRLDFGLALGALGLWLLGLRQTVGWAGLGLGGRGRAQRARGATSRVRSAMIEMELDHDSGAMRGTVLAGAFQDRSLDNLTRQDCAALMRECMRDDPEGARLLEAYLDRRFPGWGTAGDANQDARGGDERRAAPTGPMTENEAYEMLGLRKGASRSDITRAHRALMKKLHPDHGGSTHLAARANEAKDILMRRHP